MENLTKMMLFGCIFRGYVKTALRGIVNVDRFSWNSIWGVSSYKTTYGLIGKMIRKKVAKMKHPNLPLNHVIPLGVWPTGFAHNIYFTVHITPTHSYSLKLSLFPPEGFIYHPATRVITPGSSPHAIPGYRMYTLSGGRVQVCLAYHHLW